ncbi:MAG: hypothetical protein HW380_2400 [Magnetococcales bacterium]|nr:hypothetical protein [Magnetococcales bacterium]
MTKALALKKLRISLVVTSLGILSACGGGGGGNGDGGAGPKVLTGTFIDAAVDGLTYVSSPSGNSGTTSNGGQFKYLPLDTVTFKVNGMGIGSGAAAATMTPMDLVSDGMELITNSDNTTTTRAIKILQILQTLDSDGNPSNGISISSNSTLANKTLDTLDLTKTDDITTMGVTAAKVVSPGAAAAHFIGTLDTLGSSGKAFLFARMLKKTGTATNGTAASDVLKTRWATRKDAVDKAIQAKLDGLTKASVSTHGSLPGVVVRVTLPDGTPKTYTSGYYDLGKDANIIDGDEKAMDETKKFRIGSISKTFTAMTVLQLLEEKPSLITVSSTVKELLIDNKPNVLSSALITDTTQKAMFTTAIADGVTLGGATVQQLIMHLSGLPQTSSQKITTSQGGYDWGSWALTAYLDSNLDGKNKAITGTTRSAWTSMELTKISYDIGVKKPGEGWHYSNVNYILLGMIIEAVTGNPWYTEVAKRFGTGAANAYSLGVAFDSGTGPTTLPGGTDSGALGYIDWYNNFDGACQSTPECTLNTKYPVIIHPSFYGASGGLTGSVGDLYTWAGAIGNTYEGKTVAAGALVSPSLGFSNYFFELIANVLHMGLGVFKNVERKLVGHPGQVQGYDCAVWYRYDVQEPIAGCTNTTINSGGKVQEKALFGIMDLLDGKTEVSG